MSGFNVISEPTTLVPAPCLSNTWDAQKAEPRIGWLYNVIDRAKKDGITDPYLLWNDRVYILTYNGGMIITQFTRKDLS